MGENKQDGPAEKQVLVMVTVDGFKTLEIILKSQVAYLLGQAPAWLQASLEEQKQYLRELGHIQALETRLTHVLDDPIPADGIIRFELTPEEAVGVPAVLRAFSDRVRATSRDTPLREKLLQEINDLAERITHARPRPCRLRGT